MLAGIFLQRCIKVTCFDDLPKIDWEEVGDRAGAFILRNMPELMREQLPRIMAAPNKNRITKR